jgi:hypothetical protein
MLSRLRLSLTCIPIHTKHRGSYNPILHFWRIRGSDDRVRLDESFTMGPCSTSGDETRWYMTSGLTTATATPALNRETPTKDTHETHETHVENRLKRMLVRIEETLKRLRSTGVGQWWLVWVSGGRQWCWDRAKPPMCHVWPHLTPPQKAHYRDNQNPPKNATWSGGYMYMILYA